MKLVIGEKAYETVREDVERALSGEKISYERLIPYKEGNRYTKTRLVPHFSKDGNVLGVFAMIEDITDKKNARRRTKGKRREI